MCLGERPRTLDLEDVFRRFCNANNVLLKQAAAQGTSAPFQSPPEEESISALRCQHNPTVVDKPEVRNSRWLLRNVNWQGVSPVTPALRSRTMRMASRWLLPAPTIEV